MSAPRYRDALPHLGGERPFIADGGLETTLIFHRGIDLPCFAAFDLLKDAAGRDELRAYFEPYLAIARDRGVGLVLDTATWRANPDWAPRLGYSLDELDEANRQAVALAEELRAAAAGTPVVINGVIGPRGDGYVAGEQMSAAEAERYHARQIQTFAATAADMVTAITMTYPEEAIGIVRAATEAGLPVVVSFTVETDGRLPSGEGLREAIERVDAQTGGAPAYFMINCAHPRHFAGVLDGDGWLDRIGGLRANAPSSTRPTSSTTAIRLRSAPSTARCARACGRSACSAAAAAPTTATWPSSAPPGRPERYATAASRTATAASQSKSLPASDASPSISSSVREPSRPNASTHARSGPAIRASASGAPRSS